MAETLASAIEDPAPTHQLGKDSIVSGATSAAGAQIAMYALGFLGSVLIARALGPDGRGVYYLPITLAATALIVVNLSIESANTFMFAERGRTLREISETSAALAWIIGPAGAVLLVGFFELTRASLFSGVSLGYVLIAAAAFPFQLHTLWLANIFQLGRRLSRSQLASVVGTAVQTIAAVPLFIAGALDIWAVMSLYALSIVVPWALHVRWSRAFAPARARLRLDQARGVLALGAKLHLGLVVWFLLLRADVFIVSYYLGAREVGIYSLAVLLAELVWLLTNPLVLASLPYQSEAERGSAGVLAWKVARFSLLIGLVISIAFVATMRFVIPAVYGEAFAPAYPVIALLLPGIVLLAVSRALGPWLVRQNRPLTMSAIGAGAFVVNLILNIVLVPRIGIVGASVSSSIAYAGLAAVMTIWGLRVSEISLRQALMPTRQDLERALSALESGRRRIRSLTRRPIT